MKSSFLPIAFATLSLGISANAAITLGSWTFETSIPATAGPHVAEGGLFGAESFSTGFHAVEATVYSNPVGNGSNESFSSNNWTTGDYYQFQTKSAGFSGILVSFDQTRSGTGPADFQFQYGTDGVNFSTLDSYTVNQVTWSSVNPTLDSSFNFDLSSIEALDNAPAIYFRLTSTVTTVAAGANRVDNFVVSAIPEPSIALLGGIGMLGLLRRRR